MAFTGSPFWFSAQCSHPVDLHDSCPVVRSAVTMLPAAPCSHSTGLPSVASLGIARSSCGSSRPSYINKVFPEPLLDELNWNGESQLQLFKEYNLLTTEVY